MSPAELKRRPFLLDEARAAGLTRRALAGRAWRRIGSSIYCAAGWREDSFQLLEAWHRRLPGAAFSGSTAAWLFGLDLDPIHPVHVAVPLKSGVRSRPGVMVQRTDIPMSDTTLIRGLPVMALARTFRDLKRRLSRVEHLVLADEALRLGLGRFDELAEPAESPMETRLRWLLTNAGLPRPEVQTNLHDARGRFVGRGDLYYPESRLVIEYDGTNHRDRLVEDDRRQNELVAAGYQLLRFTAADLGQRRDHVVALVRGHLMSRRMRSR